MLTVSMIVKDEAPVIEKSLQAIKKYGYEIVVVDTGSKDNTKEISFKYTDKVYDYKWNNNFSEARNFAIEKAENEFVLMIDADEVIIDFNKEAVEKLIKLNEKSLGRISVISEFEDGGTVSRSVEKVSRLFSKKYYKYQGLIHEQLVGINYSKNEMYELPIKVLHNGYDLKEIKRKDKINRNLSMLEKELELKPKDPYILYQLGKTYYMAEDYEKAYVYFNKVMDIDLDVNLEYVQNLIECYGYLLIKMKRYSEALNLVNLYDVFSKSSDFVFLIGLIYMNNGMFNEAINEFLKASKMYNGKIVGVNNNLSFYNIGVIYECLGQVKEAERFYEKCSGYMPAEDRLKIISKSY